MTFTSRTNRVAARDGDLFLIVPFEAVARRNHIGRGRHLQRLAGDDAKLLVDVVDGLIADHGLPLALDRDVAVGVEAVDLGLAARIFGLRPLALRRLAPCPLDGAVMRGQGIGMHLGCPAFRHRVSAGDIDLRVLLPLDAVIGRNFDRPIFGDVSEAQSLCRRARRAGQPADANQASQSNRLNETVSLHPALP